MAYDVKFLTGTKDQYNALTSKDAGTLYFLTDTHEIYRGTELYATGTAAADFDAAIKALDATLGSKTVSGNNHVAVEVIQTDGLLTGLTVTEKDIASDAALTAVTGRVSTAEGNITTLQGQVTTINGNADTKGSIAHAVKAETERAQGVEGALSNLTTDAKTNLVAAINEVDSHANTAQSEVDALETLVGTLPQGETSVVAYIDKKADAVDDKADAIAERVTTAESEIDTLQSEMDAVEAKAAANESAIGVLNGTGTGSVKKQIDDAFNDFATKVTDDRVVNTYKELIDYCATHSAEAAEMAGDISANATAIAELEAFVGALPEGTQAATVIAYINEKVAAEESRATGIESGLNTRLAAVETAIGEGGSVGSQIDAKINALDATVETSAIAEGQDGIYVKVVEANGKLTKVEATIEVSNEVNAAKADAISTAAADATTKANDALTAAKAYTDTALTWGTIGAQSQA